MMMSGCILEWGLVTEVKPGWARVKLPAYDDIVTDWLPVAKLRAMNDDENWPYEVDEQVGVLLNMRDGDVAATGMILGAISSDADAPEAGAAAGKYRKYFSDGTYVEYDKENHAYKVNVAGSGAQWTLQTAGGAELRVKSKYRIKNGSEGAYALLKKFAEEIRDSVFDTGTGPALMNATSKAKLNAIITRMGNLLED